MLAEHDVPISDRCTSRGPYPATRSLALLVIALLVGGCSADDPVEVASDDRPTEPAVPAQTIVLDIDYGESPEALVAASEVVVRARAAGSEQLGEVFEDNTALTQYVQGFEVLESLKGGVSEGQPIKVWRLDLSEEARERGSVLAEPVVPRFEDGREYVLLLVRGKGEEPYHIAGYLSGALVVRDGMLDTTYGGDDVPSIVQELRAMTWDELRSLTKES